MFTDDLLRELSSLEQIDLVQKSKGSLIKSKYKQPVPPPTSVYDIDRPKNDPNRPPIGAGSIKRQKIKAAPEHPAAEKQKRAAQEEGDVV